MDRKAVRVAFPSTLDEGLGNLRDIEAVLRQERHQTLHMKAAESGICKNPLKEGQMGKDR